MGQNASAFKSFATALVGSISNDENLKKQVKQKVKDLPRKAAKEEMMKANPKMTLAMSGFDKAKHAYGEVEHVVKNGEVDWGSLKQVQKRKMQEVVKEFEKHAGKGHVMAMLHLGEMYEEGQGIKRDYERAQKYYRMAAGEGLAEAKYKLGMMYKNGKGLEEDWLKAVKMILEAADEGFPDAQERMGRFYEKGKGVAEDQRKAAEYYKKAADQGHQRARQNLEKMREIGDSPPGWKKK